MNSAPTAHMRLSQKDQDEIGRAGGISLTAEHRRRIEQVLQDYELKSRATPKPQKLVGAIGIGLKKAIDQIAVAEQKYPQAWKFVAQDWSTRDLDRLKALQVECNRFGALPKSQRYEFLPELLKRLSKIFQDAGGTSIGIHRGNMPVNAPGTRTTKPRHGPFVDFAWAAVSRLPLPYRPRKKEGLATQWEDILSGRKGDYSYVSAPGIFGLATKTRRIKAKRAH
jgi:hypothetical protein